MNCPSFSSFLIKIWLNYVPVTIGWSRILLYELTLPLDLHDAAGIVRITPALVPIQIKSLHASSDVTRRQAALCWRMISSQLESILLTEGAKFTSNKSARLKADTNSINFWMDQYSICMQMCFMHFKCTIWPDWCWRAYLLEWKHLIWAEFCTEIQTWLLYTAIFVIGLMSDEICSWFSTCSVELFITLIVPCTEHHNLPCTFNSLEIGFVAEPNKIVCGRVVFHVPAEKLHHSHRLFD